MAVRVPPRRIPGADLVREAGDMAGFCGRTLISAAGASRYFAEILRQASILVIGTTVVIVGMVAVIGGECGLFATYLFRSLGAESFLGTVPPVCGLREMWPYMFGYLFAAKVGCGLVAEIGSMRINEELDGLESVGVDPMRYVIATRLIAVWLTVPAIYAIAILFGAIGSTLVVLVQFGVTSRGQFESLMLATWTTPDTLYSFIKTMTIATVVALVGMYYGYRARGGPVGVGDATARSMIVNLVLIHVIGGAYSTIFWSGDYGMSFGGLTMRVARDSTNSVRPAAVTAALAGAAIALVLLAGPGGSEHTLRAAFDEAIQVVPGQEVRIAGRKVGHVDAVEELDGDAVVQMKIADADWPLPRGTTARLRFGSLGGYAGRFVELRPGPAAGRAIPDGGVLSSASTVTPVEFDQLFNTFDAPTRRNLAGTLDNAAATLDDGGASLRRAVEQGSPGLDSLGELFADLGARPEALDTLVRAGSRTSAALRSREAQLRELVGNAAGTIDELAGHARAQRAALERLPGALRAGRGTLGRLDASLVGLNALVADLGPGARALRDTAPAARQTTAALLDIAPRATRTLEIGRRNAPAIDRLLRAGTPFLPKLGSVLRRLAPMAACIRPYGPEIAGAAATWTGFTGVDTEGGYTRANLTQLPPGVAAGTALDSRQITSVYRDRVFYALPRPPGLDAGQPWFLPECGAGRGALDPAKDPELRSAR